MRLCRTIVFLTVALLLLTQGPQAHERVTGEHLVKAAFLYNFTQFVSWENAPSRDTTAGFKIGIYGDDPFDTMFDDLVSGESVGKLPIHVIRSSDFARLDSCQIVFIVERDETQLAAVIRRLEQAGTLIVGEQKGFAKLGGDIEFVVDNSRVNFIINMGSIRRAGLSASSKLQAVAKQVID